LREVVSVAVQKSSDYLNLQCSGGTSVKYDQTVKCIFKKKSDVLFTFVIFC